jgi:hypothetical protein
MSRANELAAGNAAMAVSALAKRLQYLEAALDEIESECHKAADGTYGTILADVLRIIRKARQ